jgi:hypothetical protein
MPTQMKQTSHRKRSAKNVSGDEYVTFESALKEVLTVTHSEMQSRLKADKRNRQPKLPSASRVSNEKKI